MQSDRSVQGYSTQQETSAEEREALQSQSSTRQNSHYFRMTCLPELPDTRHVGGTHLTTNDGGAHTGAVPEDEVQGRIFRRRAREGRSPEDEKQPQRGKRGGSPLLPTGGNRKQKKEKPLPDINSNMAPVTQGHPFLHGCKNLPTDKDEELKQLKSWIQTQPHLPPLTDNHLFLFLHSNYYNLEETQNTIDAYYTIRTTSPELFSKRSPSRPINKSVWDMANMAAVPGTTPEGYRVLVYRLGDPDPSKLMFVDVLKAFFLFNDVRLSEDGLAPGYIVIFDMKGVCLGHLTKINLSAIRKFMNYIQDGHPARLKGVHVINAVAFMDKVLALVRPLMKTGLISLLTIHGSDLTNLFKTVPQEILPEDYGGKAESVQTLHDQQRKMLESKYEKWIEEEECYVMDIAKRPKSSKKQCFISNSFRNLQVD